MGSDFVVHLAAKGASNDKGFLTKDRTVGALQGAQKKDRSFSIPKDEERLDIYSSTSTAFYQYPLLFLELLSPMSTSNSVGKRNIFALSEEDGNTSPPFSKCFSLLAPPSDKTLLSLPEGRDVVDRLDSYLNLVKSVWPLLRYCDVDSIRKHMSTSCDIRNRIGC